jgi:hypothetical protein
MWEMVIQGVGKNEKWMSKPLAFVVMFQICTKILVAPVFITALSRLP